MAVIVQTDPYQGLIRKIGYSVGLELLLDRVKKLTDLYVRNRSLSLGMFRDLVEKTFGRKNAVEHFANFYGTLNLLRIIARNIEPLYQLDSLSILRRLFAEESDRFNATVKLVLTQSIIEADGDIFLNGLLSEFQLPDLKGRLESMVETKRRRLSEVMRTPHLLSKIYQIVDIKNQSTAQTDGEKRVESVARGRFPKRTEPLDASRRTSPLNAIAAVGVNIPQDYLDKITQTRKGWAEDLGLFQGKERTEKGKLLLQELGKSVLSMDEELRTALFWGYSSDLKKIRVMPKDIGAHDCQAWDLLSA